MNPYRLHWSWLLFFFLLAFAFYGLRPLGEPDEGRYAQTAHEMLTSGNWLIPQLQGEPHLTKPPMTYWLAAGAMEVLGVNEWGARFFLAWAFFGTILLVISLAHAWGWTRDAGLAAGLIFSTALLPFVAGHLLTTDMLLTFFETLGITAAWKVWRGDGPGQRWRWIFWLAFALAFLTKGPPAWLPLIVMAVFLLWRGRNFQPQGRLFNPAAVVVFILLSFSWYIAVVLMRPQLLRYFLHDEVYNRVFTTEHGRLKPFWIYPPIMFGGFFPWIFLLPAMCRRTYGNLMRPGIKKLGDIKLFSLLWLVIPFLVFTFAKSRMPLYVVPLSVPLALWGGRILAESFAWLMKPAGPRKRLVIGGATLWLLVLIVVASYPEFLPAARSHKRMSQDLNKKGGLGIKTIYTIDDPTHSVSFYTGLPIKKVDLDKDEVIGFLQQKASSGEPAVMEIKKSRIKKLGSEDYEILVEDNELGIIRYRKK